VPQPLVVYLAFLNEAFKVDGSEVADVAVVQELLPARVARFYSTKTRQRIGLIDPVQEYAARLSGLPCGCYDLLEELS